MARASFAKGLTQQVAVDLYVDQGPIRPVSFWEGDNKIGIVYVAPGDVWRDKSVTGVAKWYAVAIYRSPSESGRWGIGDRLFEKGTLYPSQPRQIMAAKGLRKVS
jgi:hypothetical protein